MLLVRRGLSIRIGIVKGVGRGIETKSRLRLGLFIGLVEEEVGGQLFVLVARKVGLDHQVALKAETAQLWSG